RALVGQRPVARDRDDEIQAVAVGVAKGRRHVTVRPESEWLALARQLATSDHLERRLADTALQSGLARGGLGLGGGWSDPGAGSEHQQAGGGTPPGKGHLGFSTS